MEVSNLKHNLKVLGNQWAKRVMLLNAEAGVNAIFYRENKLKKEWTRYTNTFSNNMLTISLPEVDQHCISAYKVALIKTYEINRKFSWFEKKFKTSFLHLKLKLLSPQRQSIVTSIKHKAGDDHRYSSAD